MFQGSRWQADAARRCACTAHSWFCLHSTSKRWHTAHKCMYDQARDCCPRKYAITACHDSSAPAQGRLLPQGRWQTGRQIEPQSVRCVQAARPSPQQTGRLGSGAPLAGSLKLQGMHSAQCHAAGRQMVRGPCNADRDSAPGACWHSRAISALHLPYPACLPGWLCCRRHFTPASEQGLGLTRGLGKLAKHAKPGMLRLGAGCRHVQVLSEPAHVGLKIVSAAWQRAHEQLQRSAAVLHHARIFWALVLAVPSAGPAGAAEDTAAAWCVRLGRRSPSSCWKHH